MLPLYHDPHFTFRFADSRIISRFHLDGVGAGSRVSVVQWDPKTGERRELLREATVGENGWVDLSEPLMVRAGEGFVVIPESNGPAFDRVRLRPIQAGDLPRMFELQLDPESNRMAVTNPRSREAFDSHWAQSLDDPRCTARAVLLDDAFVGYISRFPMEGQEHVGYWIDRAFWGRGIAGRALQLLLREVDRRPLIATIAMSNGASRRVLEKAGFVVVRTHLAPASERYPACEEAVLVLE